MIHYNITCHIERSIEPTFLEFYKTEVQKHLAKNTWIHHSELYKLATEIDDQSYTFSMKIEFLQAIHFQQFIIENEQELLEILQRTFAGKIFTFCTEMHRVEF